MTRRLAITALLGLAAAATPRAAPAKPPAAGTKTAVKLVPYEVQPGDSCWSIALVVLGEASRYGEIPYCRDKQPHVIPPGTIIKVPGSLRPQAKLAWLQRDVKAKPPASVDWRRARPKMNLWRLYKVSTGGKSYAGIAFEDRSSLRMRERALLVIYGASAAATRLSRAQKHSVRVLAGAVRGGLAALDAQSKPLALATPSADVEIVSREMLLEVDRYQTSRVSVYDGHVGVKAQGAKVKVKRDYGTYVKKGQKPAKPRRLPPPPAWIGAARRVVLTTAGHSTRFEARWQSVKAARRYRFELARSRDFRSKVAVAVVGAGILRFRAQALPAGHYFARVAAIDGVGLEGRASKVLEVLIATLASSRRLQLGKDGVAEASGLLLLSVGGKDASGLELSLDGGPHASAVQPLRVRKPGAHVVHARFAGVAAAADKDAGFALRLLPVRTAFKVAAKTLRAGARHVEVEVILRDSKRRPVALPGLRVQAHPGGSAPLQAVAAGKYRAQVALPTDMSVRRVHLTVSWVGGDLDRQHVDIARAPQVPKKTPAPPAAY
ncbi:MAG: LysM peptidoglycan-binding domain-containing protein, partial [Myxococcales bacterium]|nr:LysM peptidoglycan-binding domain-containing protein [Myxococcales bacterium]